MRYDAFISYRHGGLDGQVAERLHHLLETFRIPRPIAQKIGKKSLSRIFRDKEELPTSADLSSNIQQALEESEFLLLICSPRTKESRWVMQEVDSFIALRGHARVITLLVEGEPEDVFPEQLRFREVDGQRVEVEPLAADIRAGSDRESLKKLKEETTRIMAPLLGVRYDDLRQRHRERRLKRMMGAGAAVLVLVAAFGAYALSQYLRIQQQMQLKLESQSYVLAEYAAGALRQGDVPTATLLALEGLPDNLASPERPYVPAAERALADALGVYNYDAGFTWHRALELGGEINEVFLSPDETLVAVSDSIGGTLVIEAESGRQLAHLEDIWWGNSHRCGFLATGALLQLTTDSLLALDARTQEELWRLPPAELLAVSGNGQFFATMANEEDESVVRLYDDTGALLKTTPLGEHRVFASGFGEADYNCLEVSDDGAYIAVLAIDGSLVLIKPGTEPLVLAADLLRAACAFGGKTMAYTATHWSEEDDWEEPHELVLLDLTTGQTLLRQPTTAENPPMGFLPGGDFCYAADARIIRRDATTGAESVLPAYDATVLSASVCEDTLLAGCASGNYYFTRLDTGTTMTFSGDTPCRLTALGRQLALCADNLAGSVRLLKQNTRTPAASYEGVAGYGAVHTSHDGSRMLACVEDTAHLVDLETGALLAAIPIEADYHYADRAFFSPEAGNVVISSNNCLAIYDPSGQTLLYRLAEYHDIFAGTAQWRQGDTLMVLDLDTAAVVEEVALPPEALTAWVLGHWLFLDETAQDYRVIDRRTGDEYNMGSRQLMAYWQRGETLLLCILRMDTDVLEVYDTGAWRVVFALEGSGALGAWFADDGQTLVLDKGPAHATAYTLATGAPLADLGEAGAALAGVFALPDGSTVTSYQAADGDETFALLRQPGTLAPLARVEHFVAVAGGAGLVIHNAENDALSRVPLYTTTQLVDSATQQLDGQVLTAAQRKKYHIQGQ